MEHAPASMIASTPRPNFPRSKDIRFLFLFPAVAHTAGKAFFETISRGFTVQRPLCVRRAEGEGCCAEGGVVTLASGAEAPFLGRGFRHG
jgi:hypothetical protein